MRLLLIALGFYTRYPVPFIKADKSELARSVGALPLVGAMIALPLVVLGFMAEGHLAYGLTVALMIGLSVVLTGGLHEDGLGDFFDGFWGGFTKEKTLAIMKDSRVGVFGLLAIIGILSLRFQCLVSLPPQLMLKTVFIAQMLSRSLVLPYLTFLPYARQDLTFARCLSESGLSKSGLILAMMVGVAPLALLPLWSALLTLGLGLVLMIGLGYWWLKRIDGYTGDCLGAAQQMQLGLVDFSVVLFMAGAG